MGGRWMENRSIVKNGWNMHEKWVENLMGGMFQICKFNIECDH
jgi:hypothetical protein